MIIPKYVMDEAIDAILWQQAARKPLSAFDKQYIKWFYSQKQERHHQFYKGEAMRRFEAIVVYHFFVKDKLNTEITSDDEIMSSLVKDLEGRQYKRDFWVDSKVLQIKRVEDDRT